MFDLQDLLERKPGAVLKPYGMGSPPAITVQAGKTEEWIIENWTNELHAFHIHQVHFRVLSIDGASVANPPLLDVVNVPYAEATGRSPQPTRMVHGKQSFTVGCQLGLQ